MPRSCHHLRALPRLLVSLLALLAIAACSHGGRDASSSAPPPPPPSPPGPIGPATYFVDSATGDDSADGLSPNTALRTLAAAVAKLAPEGGDRLIVSGSFRETLPLREINHPSAGAPDPTRWTVIEAARDASGQPLLAEIDGGVGRSAASFPFDKRGLPPGFGAGGGGYLDVGIEIFRCNYVRLDGLQVRGVAGKGIVTQQSSHLDLEGLTVEWLSSTAMLFSNGEPGDPPATGLSVVGCRINQCNLGSWDDRATLQGYNMTPEAFSIITFDGFRVAGNHLSNSFMEGIDFKLGSRNGVIEGNLVENLRSAGIYANEGLDTVIAHNVVRRIGWYDPQDGTGLVLAAPYLSQKVPGVAQEQGAIGILMSNGDLSPLTSLETGRVSGVRVYENTVSWTRKNGIAITNRWREEGRSGWVVEDIAVCNNVVHASCQGAFGIAAILVDGGATGCAILNNIVVGSALSGIEVPEAETFGFFATNTVANDLFFANAVNGVTGTNPILADPLFVTVPPQPGDPALFQVQPGSPAIDAGMPFGLVNTGGSPIDVGAFQTSVPVWTAGIGSGP
jgi:hypothetical protein